MKREEVAKAAVDYVHYSHTSKDSNNDAWRELGGDMDDPARDTFKWCGAEIEFACYVNMNTGQVFAYGIKDGATLVELERPVELT